MAKQDLKNGTVRLLDIFSTTWGSIGTRFDELIEPYQLDSIEKSFGFKNEFIAIDSIPPQHAKIKESEYNGVVIQYLDSVHGMDFWTEYNNQVANTYKKNRDHCGAFLADLELKSDTAKQKSNFIDEHRRIGYITNSKFPVEIRYYYSPSLSNEGSVIIIQCVEGRFVARKIAYWFKARKPPEKGKVKKIEVIELTPVNSWDSFFDSLNSMNFFNFPSMAEVSQKMEENRKMDDDRIVKKSSLITQKANYVYQIRIDNRVRTINYHFPFSKYMAYDLVKELKIADDIRNHFTSNLKPKEKR